MIVGTILLAAGCGLLAQEDVLLPVTQPTPSPRRSRATIEGLPGPATKEAKPLRIVLVAGKKDHGPGEHDYPAWQKRWAELLGKAEKVSVGTAWEWPTKEDFDSADVLVFFRKGSWKSPEEAQAFLERGGGMVHLHWAVNGGETAARFTGLAWGKGGKYRHGALDLAFADTGHPILQGLRGTTAPFYDESYWRLLGRRDEIDVLATAEEEGEPRPILWTLERGKGRIFVSIMGHYNDTFNDPLFRLLVFRGISWAARRPADRLRSRLGAGVTWKDE